MTKRRIRLAADSMLGDLAAPVSAVSRVGLEAVPVDDGLGGSITLPDLTAYPSAIEKARHLLKLAAGIEHALLVQYLYSAYSIDAANASLGSVRASIVQIAVEEMAHLLSVQNLLLLVRGQPSLKRTDRLQAELEEDRIVPFDLKFEPFNKASLAKYVVAEAPSDADTIEPTLYPVIENLAGNEQMAMIKHVGVLYLLLGVVFGDEETLNDRAGDSDWDQRVKALADAIAAAEQDPDPDNRPGYGGRDGMHLKASDFASIGDEFLTRQAKHSDWDRSPHHVNDGSDPFILSTPADRESALDLLKEISIQGEAPSSTNSGPSHFRRFIDAFRSIYGDQGNNPEPDAILKVPAGEKIKVETGGDTASEPETISNPNSAKWARLADLRYAIMLGALEQYLLSDAEDRQFLASWCFSEMFHLKTLSGFLVRLPRKSDGDVSTAAAAVPFNLPARFVAESETAIASNGRLRWPELIADSFTESISIATDLLAGTQVGSEQRQFLDYMSRADTRKLLESSIRQQGGTVRTTFDQVREILEWAAGTGSPGHGGKARFWNRELNEFRTDPIFNPAGVVAQLQSGTMPPDREPLNTSEHQPKIDAISSWIEDGWPEDRPVDETTLEIKEIRILPPLAIARLGSSDEPMDNYALSDVANIQSEQGQKALRKLEPAETLVVNPTSGEILRAVVPPSVRLRDGLNRIRPVCPFLEVWARFSDNGPFELLTETKLRAAGLTTADIRWSVSVGNLKMLRRTGSRADAINAIATSDQIDSHQKIELIGRCENFKQSRTMTLGWVQFIKPTNDFPGIRLRFTPGRGHVYGHTRTDVVPEERAIYNAGTGSWIMHSDGSPPSNPEEPRARRTTVPSGIYATTPPPTRSNLGYFDDACDGIVKVSIMVGGEEKSAMARISSGPPDFAPQNLPIRTVQDELEQMILGPQIDKDAVEADQVIDIVQRAVETMRLLSTENENESFPFWIPNAQPVFGQNGARYWVTRSLHEGLLTAVKGLKSNDQQSRRAAVGALKTMRSILREPRESWNYSTLSSPDSRSGIQHMPALMRNGDGGLLTLTERQLNLIDAAIQKYESNDEDPSPVAAMNRMIGNFAAVAVLHSEVALPDGETLADLFAEPERLLNWLANPATVASGNTSEALGFLGQRLIVAQDPANSALLSMVQIPTHPMHGPLTGYTDGVLQINGIAVLELWINSLPA